MRTWTTSARWPGSAGAGAQPGEFGAGLLLAESYAMAVEILAAVECVLAGEGRAVRQLGAGLIERATRLPGGSNPAAEFEDLPTLAEVYVLGPLEVLSGGPASATSARRAHRAAARSVAGRLRGLPARRGIRRPAPRNWSAGTVRV